MKDGLFDAELDTENGFFESTYTCLYAMLLIYLIFIVAKKSFKNRALAHAPIRTADEDADTLKGGIIMTADAIHDTTLVDMNLPDTNAMFAILGHVSGVLDASIISRIPRPFRVLATDYYDWLPFVKKVLDCFNAIKVISFPDKKKRNSAALHSAVESLKKGDDVLLFPEGAFKRPGQKLPSIKPGAAIMAILAQKPLVLFKLETNTDRTFFLPEFIRHHDVFIAIGSFFLPSSAKLTQLVILTDHIGVDVQDRRVTDPLVERYVEIMRRIRDKQSFQELLKTGVDNPVRLSSRKRHRELIEHFDDLAASAGAARQRRVHDRAKPTFC